MLSADLEAQLAAGELASALAHEVSHLGGLLSSTALNMIVLPILFRRDGRGPVPERRMRHPA